MAFYIGLMSGTSMDGIDAALVEFPSHKLLCGITKKYSAEVKNRIQELLHTERVHLAELCQLNTLIGREFGEAVNDLLHQAKVSNKDIVAIGSHGQTICHNSYAQIPYTLQMGCAHTISSMTGITVVADFRTRDMVNGGQGAPFAPIYHHELFSKKNMDLAIVNIGGISNVTFISQNKAVKGWDVGPGNCLLDAWILQNKGAEFDKDGAWSLQGEIIGPLLDELLKDSFFALRPPKSIGKEYFSLSWLMKHLKPNYQTVDVQATLLALTAHSIAHSVHTSNISELYLCGGGAHNQHLKTTLATLLPGIDIKVTSEVDIDPDFLEAMMFSWLAERAINKIPLDLSSITGAKKPAVLGAIYPCSL